MSKWATLRMSASARLSLLAVAVQIVVQGIVDAARPQDVFPQNAFGVATDQGRTFCLWTNAAVQPSTPVRLVKPGAVQTLIDATIVGPAKGCNGTISGLDKTPAYALRFNKTPVPLGEPMIAILGRHDIVIRNGIAAWLATGYGTITFRVCTSQEGFHLSAWRRDIRVWHEYFGLDYDVNATCTRKEAAP